LLRRINTERYCDKDDVLKMAERVKTFMTVVKRRRAPQLVRDIIPPVHETKLQHTTMQSTLCSHTQSALTWNVRLALAMARTNGGMNGYRAMK
jgi:hypothetical protein